MARGETLRVQLDEHPRIQVAIAVIGAFATVSLLALATGGAISRDPRSWTFGVLWLGLGFAYVFALDRFTRGAARERKRHSRNPG